mmetsp:Transcript_10826/g.23941  ORF Transcript_10826/g.23941 Transcript_10826/m.23941 type:complete len:227 (-) Transcript_10826:47-727(-)
MVQVVVVRGIHAGGVGVDLRVLVAAVQEDPPGEKQQAPAHHQGVHIQGGEHGHEEERGGPHQLVQGLVCNDGKWGWVGEDVVLLVLRPHKRDLVSAPMIEELEEIGEHEGDGDTSRQISPPVRLHPTIRLGPPTLELEKVKGEGRAEGRGQDAFHHLRNLQPHLIRSGVGSSGLPPPHLIRWLPVQSIESSTSAPEGGRRGNHEGGCPDGRKAEILQLAEQPLWHR